MKKSLIGGIAALAVVAGGTAAFALTAGGQEPVAPPAPTSTATVDPTANATAAPTPTPTPTATAAVDEAAFIAAINAHWINGDPPAQAEALAAGYEVCDQLESGVAAFGDHIMQEYAKADDALVQWNSRAWLCTID